MKISYLSFVTFPLPGESSTSAIQRTAKANGFKKLLRANICLRQTTRQSP
jgi:hypothetical protein